MKLFTKSIIATAITLGLGASVQAQPMSLLSYTNETQATGNVKKIYSEIKQAWGFVPVAIQQYSVHPEILQAQWDLYKNLGSNANLSPKMVTMMRLLVSDKSECSYCVGLNEGMLINMFKLSFEEVQALKKDASTAKLEDKQKAMLLFILQSVNHPHDNTSKNIDDLHKLGWSDKDIFDGIKMGSDMIAGALLIDALKIQKDY